MAQSSSCRYLAVITCIIAFILSPIQVAGSANGSLTPIQDFVWNGAFSFLSQTERAQLGRRINKRCDAMYEEEVIGKVHRLKDLLMNHNHSGDHPEDTSLFSDEVNSLCHELGLSGLFAFEGPQIWKRCISEVQPSRPQITQCPCHEFEDEDEERRSLLIANSHRAYQGLIHHQTEENEAESTASLLIHEYLWNELRCRRSVGPLPAITHMFSCGGREHAVLKDLVESKGLILIHPFHWKSIWSSSRVQNDNFLDDVHESMRKWLHKALEGRVPSSVNIVISSQYSVDMHLMISIKAYEYGICSHRFGLHDEIFAFFYKGGIIDERPWPQGCDLISVLFRTAFLRYPMLVYATLWHLAYEYSGDEYDRKFRYVFDLAAAVIRKHREVLPVESIDSSKSADIGKFRTMFNMNERNHMKATEGFRKMKDVVPELMPDELIEMMLGHPICSE